MSVTTGQIKQYLKCKKKQAKSPSDLFLLLYTKSCQQPDETRRVQKFHIGIKIGSHKGFKQ